MTEYSKKNKYTNKCINVIRKYIGICIWVPGGFLLYYIWSTQNKTMFNGIGLFTTILPFIFSLASWVIGSKIYFKGNQIKNADKLHILSYIYCVLAIWMFVLDIDCKIRNNDVSSIRDLSMYYSCSSLFIFLMTTWINVKSYIKRKESTMSNDQSYNK